jgi:lysylphosphatidylglycerol synthetase-like protein (DUF2156 family)
MKPASKEFLDELNERARHYGWSGDFVEISSFVAALYEEAGLEPPANCLTTVADEDHSDSK